MPGSFCCATRKMAFRRRQVVDASRFASKRRRMGRARVASICCSALSAATFISSSSVEQLPELDELLELEPDELLELE